MVLHTRDPRDEWLVPSSSTYATVIGTLARGRIEAVDFIDRKAWLRFGGAFAPNFEFNIDEIAPA